MSAFPIEPHDLADDVRAFAEDYLDLTTGDVMAKFQCSRDVAFSALEQLVIEGDLRGVNGCYVWRRRSA